MVTVRASGRLALRCPDSCFRRHGRVPTLAEIGACRLSCVFLVYTDGYCVQGTNLEGIEL